MPQFNFTQVVGIGATVFPLENWNQVRPKQRGLLELMINGTATGCLMNLTTGSEQIVSPDTAVGAGGVAGVLPSRLNNEPTVDMVEANEVITLQVRNPTAGAITINGIAVLTFKDGSK